MNDKKVGIIKVGTIPHTVNAVINRLSYCLQEENIYETR